MRIAMVLGGCAALAVGAFALVETRSGDVAPVAQQSAEPALVEQPARPAHSESATRGLQLTQQQGTVCQTPQGSVCTVAPQPINSSCLCGGTYGLIVR